MLPAGGPRPALTCGAVLAAAVLLQSACIAVTFLYFTKELQQLRDTYSKSDIACLTGEDMGNFIQDLDLMENEDREADPCWRVKWHLGKLIKKMISRSYEESLSAVNAEGALTQLHMDGQQPRSPVNRIAAHLTGNNNRKNSPSPRSALAGPVVDPHVTAVWGKKVALKCIIDVNATIIQVSWEKVHGKNLKTIAVRHPEYGTSVQGEYQGRVSFKNYSLTDATIILKNVSFSDAGEYICKAVTFPLGNTQSSTTVTVLDPPTTTTRLPTVPWQPSTDGITGLATEPRLIDFATSTLPAMQEDTWGTVIGSAVGGALFLILVSVLVGIICYRRRWTFRGDYFAKNYIPLSDMQKESQIDILQSDDMDSYPDSLKKEIKHPMDILISKDYLEDPEKAEWNNIDDINRYQESYERPMDYYEGGTPGMKYMGGECSDDNKEDCFSHRWFGHISEGVVCVETTEN